MEDLRLYNPTGVYEDQQKNSEQTMLVYPEDNKAKSIEVIAGKVVKFMLTSKGSDVFNPDYGGISMHHTQISKEYIPRLASEVRTDLDNCMSFIRQAEVAAGVEGEKLQEIFLRDIKYDPYFTPYRLDVYIEIVTTYNKRAVVAITNRTDD